MIPGRARLACGLVFAAVTFNVVLCYLNTKHILPVSESYIIASETFIVGVAAVVSYRFLNTETLIMLLLFLAYVCAIWLITGTLNPRTIRAILIPVVFFALGYTSAKPADADKLLYTLMLVVLVIGLYEWLFPESFLKNFDILSYYVAKGGLSDELAHSATSNFYVSGMRTEDAHQSFEFLGAHRVSSIFLEPVTTGNFATVSFIWLWLRHKTNPINILFLGICVLLILMSDSRFAAFSSAALLIGYYVPVLRSKAVIFAMPFVFAIALVFIASMLGPSYVDNSFTGRLVISGLELRSFDIADWFGDFGTKPSLEQSDAGYAYVFNRVGIIGSVALWALFSASNPETKEAARLKILIAIYVCFSLTIGEAFISIKTSALIWFLYGASQSRRSEEHEQWMQLTNARVLEDSSTPAILTPMSR
jgi:putative polymerase